MSNHIVDVQTSINNSYNVSMKDRKEVRQIIREIGIPKDPQNWEMIKLKYRFDIEMTEEEKDLYYSHIIKKGRHDSFVSDQTFYHLTSKGVRGVMSWDEDENDPKEEFLKFTPYMRTLIDENGIVKRECHPYLELEPNMCRTNSMEVCLESEGEYRYVEGVMIPNGFGSQITHSWNIDSDGNLFDFTLHESVTGRDTFASGSGVYFGVEIPIDIVQRVWDLTKMTPPIIPFLNITPKVEKTLGQRNG
jgi:hypothetical protein